MASLLFINFYLILKLYSHYRSTSVLLKEQLIFLLFKLTYFEHNISVLYPS